MNLKLCWTNLAIPWANWDSLSAQLLPRWIQLLGKVQQAYRRQKKESALVDFDDLERLAAQVLSNDAIRRRYREDEFNHLLVDEFQDTNDLQWQIIRALADLGRGGTLFAVGDPKQSIYQFRGADVSVSTSSATKSPEMPMGKNFRSPLHFAAIAG